MLCTFFLLLLLLIVGGFVGGGGVGDIFAGTIQLRWATSKRFLAVIGRPPQHAFPTLCGRCVCVNFACVTALVLAITAIYCQLDVAHACLVDVGFVCVCRMCIYLRQIRVQIRYPASP